MKKVHKKIDILFLFQRLALIIFLIFPVLLSVFSQILVLLHSWSFIKFVEFGFLVAIFLIPMFVIFLENSIWSTLEQSKFMLIIWVVGLAIILRIILVQLLSTDFVSDMEDVHLFAVDIYAGHPMANLQNYPNIPYTTYLTMTGIILSIIYKVFGASTVVAKLTLVILGGLTTWLVFWVGKEIANFRVGFVASLLFALLPSLLCYSGVLTGDHFALPLMMLAILLHVRLNKLDRNKKIYYIFGYALCGVVIGFIDWFRMTGTILLIALIISIILYQLGKRKIYYLALALSTLILTYFLVSQLAVNITENNFQIKPYSFAQTIGGEVLVGLNPKSNGGVTLEDKKLSGEIYTRYGKDYSAANKYLIGLALDRLRQADIPHFLKEKFSLIWSSHDALFDYSLNGSNDQEFVDLLRDIEALLYLVITIFILIGVFSSIRLRTDPSTFAMQLFILGFAILMMIFEVQNRYVVIVIPFSLLLSVLGMNEIFSAKAKTIST
jgi:4-amino-4-deoxy-L-arabinose transferase-like glycosyltransferase